jgi:hypothetical protein
MNSELLNQWVSALRSGKYNQGRLRLRSLDDHYCCLGVLCDVYDGDAWQKTYSDNYYFYGDSIALAPLIKNTVGLSDDEINKLMKMNDAEGLSFLKIADYIQENL